MNQAEESNRLEKTDRKKRMRIYRLIGAGLLVAMAVALGFFLHTLELSAGKIMGCAACALLLVEALLLMPPNRGELTIAEFAENYNFALDVLEINVDDTLDENGRWREPEYENLEYYVFDLSGDEAENYEFEFDTEDGVIRAVRFNVEAEGDDPVFHPARHLMAAMYAFVRAQKDYPLFGNILPEGTAALGETPMQSFGAQECGVQTACVVENEGYVDALGMYWFIPDNEPVPEAPRLSILFEMKRKEE